MREDFLHNKYGRDSGMKVPEGYFQTLQEQIMESLPEQIVERKSIEISRWQRYKPYVYLAAMFCGIWLMMKVFHSVSQPMLPTSLDNPPAALVQMIDEEGEGDIQISYMDEPDYDLEEEIVMEYDSIEDFEKDFGYTLSPEYASVTIKEIKNHKV
ncbi:MAG: hypothetical protein J1E95_07470 [Muribaculaceae bacterium]|nr:hypothetical protein [Muribaculaceae bacterium]